MLATAALGASLLWLVLSHSLGAYLAETAPEAALSLNPRQPVALIKLAESRLNHMASAGPAPAHNPTSSNENASRLTEFARAPAIDAGSAAPQNADNATTTAPDPAASDASPGDDPIAPTEIGALAERVLAVDPLNARALRILAQLAEASGATDRVPDLMKAAARRSLRETAAIHFMMRRSFEAADYAGTLDHADTILRTTPRLARFVVPTLARIVENAEARPLLEQRLAANPPWRSMALSTLPGAITDAHTFLQLLLALRETAAPPTAADLRGYIDVLIRHDYFELAYYAWLQFLPPEQLASAGLLFNGNFEHAPSGLPFDWLIKTGSGAAMHVTPAADLESGRALQIELGQGRVNFGHVQQTVLLAPGSYRFEGLVRGELAGPRGFVWRVSCAGKQPTRLAQSPMITGKMPTWSPFQVSFTVPEDDCRAQILRLTHDARSASEQFISGVIWIAGLKIVRE